MDQHESSSTPFYPSSTEWVDPWSRSIFDLLANWPAADGAKWTRWEPGYLLLEITKANGEEIDPIQVYTADNELTVEFGHWPGASYLGSEDEDPTAATKQAMQLVSDWMAGDVMTAVYWDANDRWCGTILVGGGNDLLSQLASGADRSKKRFTPVRVELRRPRRIEWRRFSLRGDQVQEVT